MNFFERQSMQIKKEGWKAYLLRKFIVFKRILVYFIPHLIFYFIAIPVVLIMRLIRPWFLIRFESLGSDRIGHLAADTELYFCERDAKINIPRGVKRYVDFFYFGSENICNKYLLSKWKELLCILPEIILAPVRRINRFLPGWEIHEIGRNTQGDRDVHNLFMRYPSHLKFTQEEEKRGAIELKKIGVPEGRPFVCLLVRDAAYKNTAYKKDSYIEKDEYRNSDIDNYILVVEELVKRGYCIIRMGVVVEKPLKINHLQVIDYAWKGLRSEFMDIYLGAKCDFCISTGSGWDTIPYIFRRPIVFTNFCQLASIWTYGRYLTIPKRCKDSQTGRDLSIRRIFDVGLGFRGPSYIKNPVELVENTPEEICDVVIEMVKRLNDVWQTTQEDEDLQRHFWEIFLKKVRDFHRSSLHGKIYGRIGRNYLRNHRYLLE